jgi:hypothetical protein
MLSLRRGDINAAWFVRIEGRRLGREAAKAAIRDSGAKLSSFSMKEITMLGEEWFQSHRDELMQQAWRTLLRVQLRKVELAQYRRASSVCSPPKFRTLRNSQASKAKELPR